MIMLIAGVLCFTGFHLMPSVAPGVKESLVQRVGFNGYRGLFSLAVGAAMALIIFGWRSAEPTYFYHPQPGIVHGAMGLVALGFYLMVLSNRPSRIKKIVRHPQLSGVILWATAHLLLNGDSRSFIVFGGLGLWAIIEIIAINRRDAWEKPEAPGIAAELVNVIIAAVVVAVVIAIHPYISGYNVMAPMAAQ
jgi:uncharacterized membrane protein